MDLAIKIMSGKFIRSRTSSDHSGSNWQDAYASEKKILNLKHVNVVRTLAMSRRHASVEEPIYIFMEYAGNSNLLKALNEPADSWTPRRLLRYVKHIAMGLQYVHSQGIVHMDVKPANVIISSRDVAKLGDFGCCISADKAPLTTTPDPFKGELSLHVPGTPAYSAPELFRGRRATKKCDMYSLAICLWQMLTRRPDPYPGMKQPHVLIYCVVKYHRRPVWDDFFWPEGNLEFRREFIALTECNWNGDPEARQTTKELLKFAKRWKKKI